MTADIDLNDGARCGWRPSPARWRSGCQPRPAPRSICDPPPGDVQSEFAGLTASRSPGVTLASPGALGAGSGHLSGHHHVRPGHAARTRPRGTAAKRSPGAAGRRHEPGVPPRPAPAVPAQAARRGAPARLRGHPAAAGPLHGRVRTLARHDLPPAGPAGGGGPGHPRRGRRPEGLPDHRRRAGRSFAARLDDLAELEAEITASVRDIAREVTEDVRETVRNLREELTSAARDMQGKSHPRDAGHPRGATGQARRAAGPGRGDQRHRGVPGSRGSRGGRGRARPAGCAGVPGPAGAGATGATGRGGAAAPAGATGPGRAGRTVRPATAPTATWSAWPGSSLASCGWPPGRPRP